MHFLLPRSVGETELAMSEPMQSRSNGDDSHPINERKISSGCVFQHFSARTIRCQTDDLFFHSIIIEKKMFPCSFFF